jgi:hypothetical protein
LSARDDCEHNDAESLSNMPSPTWGGTSNGSRPATALEPLLFLRQERYDMAKLIAAKRNKISGKNFALPGRRYPIEDRAHAKNALARVSQHGSPAEKAAVRRKVHGKFPNIAVGGLKKTVKKKAGSRKRAMSKG